MTSFEPEDSQSLNDLNAVKCLISFEILRFTQNDKRIMSKHQEYQYLDLAKEALEHGIRKVDRGTNVVLHSLFGRQTRYDLSL